MSARKDGQTDKPLVIDMVILCTLHERCLDKALSVNSFGSRLSEDIG